MSEYPMKNIVKITVKPQSWAKAMTTHTTLDEAIAEVESQIIGCDLVIYFGNGASIEAKYIRRTRYEMRALDSDGMHDGWEYADGSDALKDTVAWMAWEIADYI